MSGQEVTRDQVLRIPVQHITNMRIYGPGMPKCGDQGLRQRTLVKPVGQVGLVSVHCWNLGEPSGPYPIGPDAHCPGEVADWVPTAHEIIANRVKPVLEAARRAGIAVFHLAAASYAPRYPQYQAIAADPELRSPNPPSTEVQGCVRPWTQEEQWGDFFGRGFPGAVWDTHADAFDIAEAARPLPDEAVFRDGWQLNGLCRRMDIDTLIYLGFMANICLLEVPGALREMARKFQYRCVVLRDCTIAYEYADTYAGGTMTQAAIRVVEQELGYSTTSQDFIRTCEAVSPPGSMIENGSSQVK